VLEIAIIDLPMTVSWRNSCLQPETAFLLLRPVHWINLQGQQRAGGPHPSRP
jgi:hypothetical protein